MMNNDLQSYITQLAFRSNQNLRPAGVEIEYTEEMLDEMAKCASDPIYFIEKYVKVVHVDRGLIPFKLYDYQKEMVLSYKDKRKVISLLPRQSGKCFSLNTKVKIRTRGSDPVELTIGELYEWQNFRNNVSSLQDQFSNRPSS